MSYRSLLGRAGKRSSGRGGVIKKRNNFHSSPFSQHFHNEKRSNAGTTFFSRARWEFPTMRRTSLATVASSPSSRDTNETKANHNNPNSRTNVPTSCVHDSTLRITSRFNAGHSSSSSRLFYSTSVASLVSEFSRSHYSTVKDNADGARSNESERTDHEQESVAFVAVTSEDADVSEDFESPPPTPREADVEHERDRVEFSSSSSYDDDDDDDRLDGLRSAVVRARANTHEFPFLRASELEERVRLLEALSAEDVLHGDFTRDDFQKLVHDLMVSCARLRSVAGARLTERLLARAIAQGQHRAAEGEAEAEGGGQRRPLPSAIMYNVAMDAWAKSRHKNAHRRVEEILTLMRAEHEGVERRRRELLRRYDEERRRREVESDGGPTTTELPPFPVLPNEAAQPDAFHYSTVITAWGRSYPRDSAVSGAQRIFDAMLRERDAADAKSDDDDDDVSFAVSPDVTCYNAVMSAWERSRRRDAPQRVEALFDNLRKRHERTQEESLLPDNFTYTILVNSYAYFLKHHEVSPEEKEHAVRRVESLLAELHRRSPVIKSDENDDGVRDAAPDTAVHNAVLHVLCLAGEVHRAEDLLERMTMYPHCRPNVYSHNTVLNGWAASGENGRAARMLERLTERGRVNDVACNTVLKAHVVANDPDRALELLERMAASDDDAVLPRPNTVSYATVLHGLRDRPESAARLLDDMTTTSAGRAPAPNARCFQSVVEAWLRAGDVGRAEDVLWRMRDHGRRRGGANDVAPTTYTCNLVLRGWADSDSDGRTRAARSLLRWMADADDSRARPDVDSYNAVVDACRGDDVGDDESESESEKQKNREALSVAVDVYETLLDRAAKQTSNERSSGGGNRRPRRRHRDEGRPPDDDEIAVTPNSDTYRRMLRVIATRVRNVPERSEHAQKVFGECCRYGMLDDGVLRQFHDTVPKDVFELRANRYRGEVAAGQNTKDGAREGVFGLNVRDYPPRYSRNRNKPQRNNRKRFKK